MTRALAWFLTPPVPAEPGPALVRSVTVPAPAEHAPAPDAVLRSGAYVPAEHAPAADAELRSAAYAPAERAPAPDAVLRSAAYTQPERAPAADARRSVAAAVSAIPLADAAPELRLTGAAVLGRPREAEPVGAALALALRRETRARAATVAIIGAPLPDVGGGGGGAARRLAARLEALGLEARVRGRLAWVRLDPADPHLAEAARHIAFVAAPAVLVVTAPRTAAIDAALAEQDLLVIVTAYPDGPLVHAAGAGLAGVRVVPMRPLARGPARELARAGLRPTASIRSLVGAPARRRR